MDQLAAVLQVSLIGFVTTVSSIVGAAVGLYTPIRKRVLACILAFAAGSLICALAIDLAYEGAQELHAQGLHPTAAWALIGGGFALGAIIYYIASLYLDQKGAAVRLPSRFREYALERKQEDQRALIALLAKSDLMRHVPAEVVECVIPMIQHRRIGPGEILFRAGEPGDALYIIARGKVEVLADDAESAKALNGPLAVLGEGHAFGEMALLSGRPRTATIRAVEETDLLEISKVDFERLIATERQIARAVENLSHERAIKNLAAGGADPDRWASVATSSLSHVTRGEADRILAEAGHGAGLAIIFGNILDTIPGCLVIGAKFSGFESMSFTLILGMFLGGIPEAAASAAILTRAGFTQRTIFALWSTVLLAGILAAAAGHIFLGGSASLLAVFAQGIAGGAVLALVSHAMIPEAIHDGRSLIVLPTIAGFLFALYLSLTGGSS